MDIRQEIRKLVPAGALGLLGIERPEPEPLGDDDLTILFTDLDDHTAITDRLGDLVAHELVRVHDRLVRAALAGSGGREVKHTGDGIMASFSSAARALQAAVAIQRSVRAWNGRHDGPAELRVAIGMNSGSPIAEHGDLFGTAVIVAARITDETDGGQILVSDVVRQLAAGKGFVFHLLGTRLLEGMAESIPLFEVVWQEGESAAVSAAT